MGEHPQYTGQTRTIKSYPAPQVKMPRLRSPAIAELLSRERPLKTLCLLPML